MGRPKKQTVDYFPHICRHGKTIFILEQKYGNDGYAFWFKLLELLGDTEGHSIDCNNPTTWEFLQSKTRLSEDTCIEVLNLLSRLDAIDFDLWQNRIIWSENFIKGIAEVYRNRRVEIPARPPIYIQKPTTKDQSTTKKPQSRVEESKEKKRNTSAHLKTDAPHSYIFSSQFFDIDQIYFERLQADYPGLDPPRLMAEIKKAADWCEDNPKKFKRKSNGKRANVKTFLRNWLSKVEVRREYDHGGVDEWLNKTSANG